MRAPLRLAVPALAVSLALVSGCAEKGDVDAASSSEGSTAAETSAAETSAVPSTAETPAADFPGDTEPDTENASGDARVTVSDVRLAAQDGFDRIVFDLGGAGTPGWNVQYVEDPIEPGRGEPVQLEGGAVLQVEITGAGYPFETGIDEFSSAGTVTAAGTGSVTEIEFLATFEGVTTAFVGTQAEAPFRVYLLENPMRVVVEVAHAG
ncbi:hypothetical protein [Blastococcus sp. LR1]|uniref:AMIN-like domain-containing (lipo)protein n=1 Tax=Blastococcus sp. LR1 TaxID=2877000 RepID=UPI001CCE29C9|nr:hypothetical protein [Blastococcus sp. LR1]MCA0145874.1 hypothetical protein [Blastococcus sp. LR1]